jgi:signal transduction histidine kinase/CheY-like chemotaxis protein
MSEGEPLDRQDVAERVLIVAPLGRDAAVLARVLADAGVSSSAFANGSEIARALLDGAGTVLLTEEALTSANVRALLDAVASQPAWSDLPLVLLADPEPLIADRARHVEALREVANLTVLERPVRVLPLVTAVHAALRARRRQYEIRDLVASEQAAREAAEAASHVKDEFLATVSHELRTPLSAILLWIRLLATGGLEEARVRRALDSIERSAEAQSKLIEDLLDVSRMISGKLKLNLRPVDLGPIAHAALEIIRPAAEAKRITVEAEVEERTVVRADPARIQQIMWNLLSNAVKFTPEGGRVSMVVSRDGGRVRIEVVDTGRGIPADFLPYVFDRFRQVDGTSSRREGGLGLGLAISRQLVEMHGGTIRAESAGEDRGAVFCVELPALDAENTVSTSGPSRTHDERSLEDIEVLLVEDDPDTREALVLTLEQRGAEVLAVASAGAALTLLEGRAASDRPDVLLSDLGLPGINGYELLRRVRAMEVARGEDAIPAALITAYAGERDRQQALDAGFSAHLAKPVEPTHVAATVLQLASRRPNQASATKASNGDAKYGS